MKSKVPNFEHEDLKKWDSKNWKRLWTPRKELCVKKLVAFISLVNRVLNFVLCFALPITCSRFTINKRIVSSRSVGMVSIQQSIGLLFLVQIIFLESGTHWWLVGSCDIASWQSVLALIRSCAAATMERISLWAHSLITGWVYHLSNFTRRMCKHYNVTVANPLSFGLNFPQILSLRQWLEQKPACSLHCWLFNAQMS